MEQPLEADNKKDVMPDKHNILEFRKVCFGYERDKQILLNASFTIPDRKVTAFVGPSGSGKTTIFSLIERFYDPETGNIYWGDTPIDSFSLHDWRKKLVMCLKKALLYQVQSEKILSMGEKTK
ncbi:ATP-binding cassette domain-containing protein [Niallia circulans]